MASDSAAGSPPAAQATKAALSPSPSRNFSDSGRINVFCRFRPSREDASGPSEDLDGPRISVDESRSSVAVSEYGNCREYFFDGVLGPQTTQQAVFALVEPLVEGVLEGYNGTCLAYGQTSSGKTFTMEGTYQLGEEAELEDGAGVIPRAAKELFAKLERRGAAASVKVSFVEIYNEKVRDLLHPAEDNLRIVEDPEHGVVVSGARESPVDDAPSVLAVLNQGKINRTTAATLMNAHSSRAHSILQISVQSKGAETGQTCKARLTLVDLAGSEKVSKTGAKGQRLKEAQNINRSLTTLGMVITALSRGYRHVPYRDSRLTRLLSESLGGNSRTILLTCVAPESVHAPETISTLRFGESAKRIMNQVSRNEVLTVEELTLKLKLANAEIRRLRKQLGLPSSQTEKEEKSPRAASEASIVGEGAPRSASEPSPGLVRSPSDATQSSSEGDDEIEEAWIDELHRIQQAECGAPEAMSEEDVVAVCNGGRQGDAKENAIEKEAETAAPAVRGGGASESSGDRRRVGRELVHTVVASLERRLAEREREVFDQAQEIDRLETESAAVRAQLEHARGRARRRESLQTMDWDTLVEKAVVASERAAQAEEQLESAQEENSEILERLLKQNAQLLVDKDKLRRENWMLSQKVRDQAPSSHRRSLSFRSDLLSSGSWSLPFFRPVLSPKSPVRQRSRSPKGRRKSPPRLKRGKEKNSRSVSPPPVKNDDRVVDA
eukprot:scaffold1390_cov249-Pinguiococcus_pyrenoidosus.AAC.25